MVNYGQLRICVQKKIDIKGLKLKNKKLKAAFLKTFIWPSESNLKIYFMDKNPKNIEKKTYDSILRDNPNTLLDPLQKKIDSISNIPECIKLVINERYSKFLNLKFTFVNNIKDSNIRIAFEKKEGAWSYVGTDCNNPVYKNEATMNFGWIDVSTILHEFGHALGLVHEHQNPKHNEIDWDEDKVYSWAKSTQGWDHETTYENIMEAYKINEINGSVFDPFSIMLYFFPDDLTKDNKGTKENLKLSPNDVIYLSETYPNGKMNPADFYKEAYNEDINKIIKEQQSIKTGSGQDQNNKMIYLYITIVILIIVIFVLILVFK